MTQLRQLSGNTALSLKDAANRVQTSCNLNAVQGQESAYMQLCGMMLVNSPITANAVQTVAEKQGHCQYTRHRELTIFIHCYKPPVVLHYTPCNAEAVLCNLLKPQ